MAVPTRNVPPLLLMTLSAIGMCAASTLLHRRVQNDWRTGVVCVAVRCGVMTTLALLATVVRCRSPWSCGGAHHTTAATAAAAFSLGASLLTFGIVVLPLGIGSAIAYGYPIYAVLLGRVVFHDVLTARAWWAIGASLVAMLAIVWPETATPLVRADVVIAAMIGSVLYAVHVVLLQRVREIDTAVLMLWKYGGQSVVLLAGLAASTHYGVFAVPPHIVDDPLDIVASGAFYFGADVLAFLALQRSRNTMVIMVMYVDVVMALGLQWCVFHETLLPQQVVATILLVAALLSLPLREGQESVGDVAGHSPLSRPPNVEFEFSVHLP